ncbi:ammonia-dependent NAD(+) synthetase [Salisediminibacterium beveridgei]|uniref:NH(3)-dependent NAD(+) synthetase n=1 Tax=Salisediminibacterium beveridgei TaxID=632773 RepID=A0A1D7QVN4_9BACI|nr:ammonia-dependent NAD(+) synthetase [Salisediminibacterium beveridgei]AOM83065.1 NH(3)-dependent NAD(+) synthetase [Salisediminibacterium beveridgei]
MQHQIIETLQVKPVIEPKEEIRNRVEFLKGYLQSSGMSGYILGISGGQDSLLTGLLIQQAISELNEEAGEARYCFYAARLPYGTQKDEADAQEALSFIDPDRQITLNIKPAVDAAMTSFKDATGEEMSDFVKGNTKARERMKAQYDLGAHYRCLIAGTDHAAEAVTGFYTKFGDGACDVAPLFGLTKGQGRELLEVFGAPSLFYTKAPTADLEDDKPQLPDEEALGITYRELDTYLTGGTIDEKAKAHLETIYVQTTHKRELPVTPFDSWWK